MVSQDGWSSFKEVTLKDLASDEQYDPDTVYGEAVLLMWLNEMMCDGFLIEVFCFVFFSQGPVSSFQSQVLSADSATSFTTLSLLLYMHTANH